MTPLYGMTRRQMDLLAYLHRYISEHGYSPTYSEAKNALGLASISSIHRLVHGLEQRGLVRCLPRQSRSLCLTNTGTEHAARFCIRSVSRLTSGQAA